MVLHNLLRKEGVGTYYKVLQGGWRVGEKKFTYQKQKLPYL